MLLAGGDLITSMGEPGVWADDDLQHILGLYGCLIVERTGSDVWGFLLSHDILYKNRKNIVVIKQLIYNDISSTKVRYLSHSICCSHKDCLSDGGCQSSICSRIV